MYCAPQFDISDGRTMINVVLIALWLRALEGVCKGGSGADDPAEPVRRGNRWIRHPATGSYRNP